jgi:group I intron endonuclease
MHYYLYEIKNKVNGNIYVGVHKTDDLSDGYMGSGKVIKRAIKKHGLENFTKTILETFDSQEELYCREKEVVDEEFLAREDTYNLRVGGLGGWDFVNTDEELRRQRSIRVTGAGNSFYGRTHSDEIKAVLAEYATKQWKGVPKSEEHKQKIAAANTGTPHTPERCKNISEAKRGKPAPNKGKPAPKLTCPHCNMTGGNSNMTRWHFDNCRKIKCL